MRSFFFELNQLKGPKSARLRVPGVGIVEVTVYAWKKRYGELGFPEVGKRVSLPDENARLKRLLDDLTLNRRVLQFAPCFEGVRDDRSALDIALDTFALPALRAGCSGGTGICTLHFASGRRLAGTLGDRSLAAGSQRQFRLLAW